MVNFLSMVGFELRTSQFAVKIKSTFLKPLLLLFWPFGKIGWQKFIQLSPTSWKSSVQVPITYKLIYGEGWLHPVFQFPLSHCMGLQRSLRLPEAKILRHISLILSFLVWAKVIKLSGFYCTLWKYVEILFSELISKCPILVCLERNGNGLIRKKTPSLSSLHKFCQLSENSCWLQRRVLLTFQFISIQQIPGI